jgi:ubiquinone/menaquinone biosynthesis C-methylase UbiE
MAYEYPSAIFIGVDISPIFPSDQKKPENATFLQNMLDGLPFEDNTFDFVYQRSLASAISEDQWKNDVIYELYRVTKPGGWIELMYVIIDKIFLQRPILMHHFFYIGNPRYFHQKKVKHRIVINLIEHVSYIKSFLIIYYKVIFLLLKFFFY